MGVVAESRPIACTSEYDAWPPELRIAWAALSAAEQRLLLRARWRWRSWPNPVSLPPKPPQKRYELEPVSDLLYQQELAYRAYSVCRGADGEVTNTRRARIDGFSLNVTPDTVLDLLRGHPGGLTTSDLLELLPHMRRTTLLKWLGHAKDEGQVHESLAWEWGGERWFVGTPAPALEDVPSDLNPAARETLVLIRQHPGIPLLRLAEQRGVNIGVSNKTAKALQARGLIRIELEVVSATQQHLRRVCYPVEDAS